MHFSGGRYLCVTGTLLTEKKPLTWLLIRQQSLICQICFTQTSGGHCWGEGELWLCVKQMSSFQRENEAAKSLFRRLEVLCFCHQVVKIDSQFPPTPPPVESDSCIPVFVLTVVQLQVGSCEFFQTFHFLAVKGDKKSLCEQHGSILMGYHLPDSDITWDAA